MLTELVKSMYQFGRAFMILAAIAAAVWILSAFLHARSDVIDVIKGLTFSGFIYGLTLWILAWLIL